MLSTSLSHESYSVGRAQVTHACRNDMLEEGQAASMRSTKPTICTPGSWDY